MIQLVQMETGPGVPQAGRLLASTIRIRNGSVSHSFERLMVSVMLLYTKLSQTGSQTGALSSCHNYELAYATN